MKTIAKLALVSTAFAASASLLSPAFGQAVSDAGVDVSDVFATTVILKSPAEEEAVRSRPQPEYSPVGGRVGSYFLYPWLENAIIYNDNIYATPHDQVGGALDRTSGAMVALSNFVRHALNFRVSFDNYTYFNESRQDRTDVSGEMDWRLDFANDFNVTGFVDTAYRHQAPGSLEAPTNALEPVPYTDIVGSLSLNKRFNRLSGSLTGTAETINYSNVPAVGGGTLDQNFRDGQTYTVGTRWSYEFSPGYAGFALLEGNIRDFNNDGYGRSSKGAEALAGVEFDITSLMHGDIGVGYLAQDFDKQGLKTISGWAMRGSVLYNPTPLITMKLTGERRVGETIQTDASGRLDTIFRMTVDYELLRNLILSPYVSYANSDYEGSGRKDNFIHTGIKADYILNRNFSTNIFYEYTDRNSNFGQYDYQRNYTGVGLKARF